MSRTQHEEKSETVSGILRALRETPDDERQWRTLYRIVWPIATLQAVRSLYGDVDAADDVAQEALIRVVSTGRISNFASGKAFLVYLHITVDSVAIGHLRREGRKQRLLNSVAIHADNAEEDWTTEWRVWIERASERLEPTERDLLVEVLGGSSLPQIAARLSLTYSAAGVRLHRLRRKLRNLLAENNIESSSAPLG